jgi:hypothetical protein
MGRWRQSRYRFRMASHLLLLRKGQARFLQGKGNMAMRTGMVGTFRVDATQAECQEILRGEGTLECPSYQDLGTRGPPTGIGSNIYILNISGTVFFVGDWCIFSMHPDPEMNKRSNGTTFEVRTSCPAVCRILTMKSNSTDLRRIFRVARNGIAPSQFVSYSDLSSASADIKAHRMGR